MDDRKAIILFRNNKDMYDLDSGGLSYRYQKAREMTNEIYKDTVYCLNVEEFCCNCTVTWLVNSKTREKLCN